MNEVEFYVKLDQMTEFVEILTDPFLYNEIKGVSEENDIVVGVKYKPNQIDSINELKELADFFEDDDTDSF